MEIQILLSTIKQTGLEELIKQMNIKTNYLIISQGEKKCSNGLIYSFNEKGLSKSRNKAIQYLSKEIGVFADDDVIYEDNCQDIIKQAYEEYQEADIIAFYVESTNPKRAVRKQKTHKVNRISAMRIQSFQITFRRDSIKNKLYFDEDFGANAKYSMGEENIFLYDALKKGMKIYYIDKKIGIVRQEQSTWFEEYNKKFFEDEGAILYRISRKWYWLLIVQFIIRKRKLYSEKNTMRQVWQWMFRGAKNYGTQKKC